MDAFLQNCVLFPLISPKNIDNEYNNVEDEISTSFREISLRIM